MRRAAAFVLAVVGIFILAVPGWAQTYPSKNVTIIVPYPAGGPTDQVARVLAQALQDKLKQNFIVENISGGGTTIATGRVAHAAPDGYTLLIHNLQISANVALYKNVNYDTEIPLASIAQLYANNGAFFPESSGQSVTSIDALALTDAAADAVRAFWAPAKTTRRGRATTH